MSAPSEPSLPDNQKKQSQFSASSAPPAVLTIAGFDPSAGAGVLADLKTFAALGVYGMACVTALTVQSTLGVVRVEPVDPDIVIETLDCLAADAFYSAIKVGMLGTGAIVKEVFAWLDRQQGVPVVLDPVIKSSSGKELLDGEGLEVLRENLLGRVDWITPNLDELAILTGLATAKTRKEIEDSARSLWKLAAQRGNPGMRIVVTGGHAVQPDDLLLARDICEWFPGEHIETSSTHGTGCAFSSALAARLALGDAPVAAVQAAKDYVAGALRHAYPYPMGRGKGPINHFWAVPTKK